MGDQAAGTGSRRRQGSLVVGAVAYHPKAVTIWETIRDLFRSAAEPLDFVLFSNYEAQVEALFRGHIDVAWNTPVAWVRCLRRSAGAAVPLAMRDTDLGFTTRLIGREGSGVNGLADLRGKRVAFGSRDSAQASILPRRFLRAAAGLAEGSDYQALRFDIDVGKHGDTGASEEEVLRSLRSYRADAGAVGSATWDAWLASGAVDRREMKVLWTSPGYSHCNFTALPTLEEARARAFVDRLLAMDYGEPEVKRMMDLEGLRRWVPGQREGYEELERAMAEEGLL